MALIGKWIQTIEEISDTEFKTVLVKYPDVMVEGEPNFEKAGLEVEEQQPVINIKKITHKSVYINVHSVTLFKLNIEGQRNYMNVNYRVYKSKKDSLDDVYSSIFDDHLLQKEILFDSELSPTEQAYNYVKELEGFQNLKND